MYSRISLRGQDWLRKEGKCDNMALTILLGVCYFISVSFCTAVFAAHSALAAFVICAAVFRRRRTAENPGLVSVHTGRSVPVTARSRKSATPVTAVAYRHFAPRSVSHALRFRCRRSSSGLLPFIGQAGDIIKRYAEIPCSFYSHGKRRAALTAYVRRHHVRRDAECFGKVFLRNFLLTHQILEPRREAHHVKSPFCCRFSHRFLPPFCQVFLL